MIRLTAQQTRVLALAGLGLTKKAMATRMGLSCSTIATHRAHLFEKLNARNMAHAVVIAYRSGLVTDDDLVKEVRS